MRCSKYDECELPVCPLDPEVGIVVIGERECGARVDGQLHGLDPDERWELDGGRTPRHGLTQDEHDFIEAGEDLLIGGIRPGRGKPRAWRPPAQKVEKEAPEQEEAARVGVEIPQECLSAEINATKPASNGASAKRL